MTVSSHTINGSGRRRTVSDVMTKQVHVAGPLAPFKQLVRLIAENRVSAIPIVDQRGVPIGIVSESDLLEEEKHLGRPNGTTASRFMTSPVITVAADATSIIGDWGGTLDPGAQPKKRLVVHIAASAGLDRKGRIFPSANGIDDAIVGDHTRAYVPLIGNAVATPQLFARVRIESDNRSRIAWQTQD